MNRFTTLHAKLTLKKHNAKLVHGNYGFGNKGRDAAGCAVSCFLLHALQDPYKVNVTLLRGAFAENEFAVYAAACGTTESYMRSLESGFERPHRDYVPLCPKGYEDGKALRELV